MKVKDFFKLTDGHDLNLPAYLPDGGPMLQAIEYGIHCIFLMFSDTSVDTPMKCSTLLRLKQLTVNCDYMYFCIDGRWEVQNVEFVEDDEFGDYYVIS